MTFLGQLKRNQLAIISLLVAFAALGYNTWRNELTEHNRSIREAGFTMLVHIGELQKISFLAHYDNDALAGNPRKGWTEVLLLRDLSELMPASTTMQADIVLTTWEANWAELGTDDSSVQAIDGAIDDLRQNVIAELSKLN